MSENKTLKDVQLRRQQNYELVELFGEATKKPKSSLSYAADRSLYHLLDRYKDDLPPVDHNWHKAFQQVDVTDSEQTDMAIYLLAGKSELFWESFSIVRTKYAKQNTELNQDKS